MIITGYNRLSKLPRCSITKKKTPLVCFVLIFKKIFSVSHIPQRKEKDCLNCGEIVQGRYCQNCGQENVVPKETFLHMVTHFFNDITHFDGSFFTSVKDLLFKPGFLSKEYMLGRRVKYLHPIRMYVFTSAIFFLLFFSIFKIENAISVDLNRMMTASERQETLEQLESLLKKDTANQLLKLGVRKLKDTSEVITAQEARKYFGGYNVIRISGRNYSSIHEYDSVQSTLPKEDRDGWLGRRFNRKVIAINIKYRDNPEDGFRKMGDSVLHKLPYMLFVSLPLFALILRLVYIRRRKTFYFADHGVFTIHLYVFTFIILMVIFGVSQLVKTTGVQDFDYLMFALILWLMYYLYRAMQIFYGQRKFKTFIKFLLVVLLSLIMMILLLVVFLLFSAFML